MFEIFAGNEVAWCLSMVEIPIWLEDSAFIKDPSGDISWLSTLSCVLSSSHENKRGAE